MTKISIDIAKDFSRYPSGRHLLDGPNSAERFREEFLWPALTSPPDTIEVNVNTYFSAAWADEAFGGLIKVGFHREDLLRRFRFLYPKVCKMYVDHIREVIATTEFKGNTDD